VKGKKKEPKHPQGTETGDKGRANYNWEKEGGLFDAEGNCQTQKVGGGGNAGSSTLAAYLEEKEKKKRAGRNAKAKTVTKGLGGREHGKMNEDSIQFLSLREHRNSRGKIRAEK